MTQCCSKGQKFKEAYILQELSFFYHAPRGNREDENWD
jgi:hypothetical protein